MPPDDQTPRKDVEERKEYAVSETTDQLNSSPDSNRPTVRPTGADEVLEGDKKERRERIRTWQTLISIFSLTLGLPVAVTGLWGNISSAFRKAEPPTATTSAAVPPPAAAANEKEALEIQKLRLELRAGEPRFREKYLVIRSNAFNDWESGKSPSLGSLVPAVTYRHEVLDRVAALYRLRTSGEETPGILWSVAQINWTNGIHGPAELRRAFDAGKVFAHRYEVVCLQLRQEGKRKAENIKLTVRKTVLGKAIELPNIGLLADDERLRELTGESISTEEIFEFNALAEGESIIVPLVVVEQLLPPSGEEGGMTSKEEWYLVRDWIYLPIKIEFSDRLMDAPHAMPIRKLFTKPEVLATGVEARG